MYPWPRPNRANKKCLDTETKSCNNKASMEPITTIEATLVEASRQTHSCKSSSQFMCDCARTATIHTSGSGRQGDKPKLAASLIGSPLDALTLCLPATNASPPKPVYNKPDCQRRNIIKPLAST